MKTWLYQNTRPVVKFRNFPMVFNIARISEEAVYLNMYQRKQGTSTKRVAAGDRYLDDATHWFCLDQALLLERDPDFIDGHVYRSFVPICNGATWFSSCVAAAMYADLTADHLFQSLKVKLEKGVKVKCERNYRGAYRFQVSNPGNPVDLYNIVGFLDSLGLTPSENS